MSSDKRLLHPHHGMFIPVAKEFENSFESERAFSINTICVIPQNPIGNRLNILNTMRCTFNLWR